MGKKRFIVTLNDSTTGQKAAFHAFVSERFNWWHWMENTWLLIDNNGSWNHATLSNKLETIFPNVYFMLFEIGDNYDTWSGFGPANKANEKFNMFKWLDDYWNK